MLKGYPQYLMPGHLISRLTYRLMRIESPAVKNRLIRLFMRLFQISLAEAQIQQAEGFLHFNAFFTRALKPECRPIAGNSNTIISPVDGMVSQFGAIRNGRIIQAKGHDYSVAELLATVPAVSEQFSKGHFITIYLSPRDYHRIHQPLDGLLRQMIHVPGRLFSVNLATAATINRLFAKNERVITLFDSDRGPFAQVLVGAVNVGSIETVWAGEVTPPSCKLPRAWSYAELTAPRLQRGEEMGRFNMGSTVILLIANPELKWDEKIMIGSKVRMGEALAQFTPDQKEMP
ncbi:MAG: phosphatidylserine decarboxylase [Gammaproteobacteria bacterium]|nr:phosphatidylserine decarboxylase [Gammaproteobacteria bacterium]